MLHRRTTVALAASAALVLAGAAPALADHIDPDEFSFDVPEDFDGDSVEFPGNLTCDDFGLEPAPASEDWDDQGKVDPPVEINNDFVTTTLAENEDEEDAFLDVVAKDDFVITAVLVKGGQGGGGTAYFHPPFEEMIASTNQQGNPQSISHYNICGFVDEDDETPPPEEEEDENGDEKDENGEEEEENGKEDDGDEVEVPTEVPAGHEGSSGGISAGTIGLIAAATALLAGAAALVRRRFINGS